MRNYGEFHDGFFEGLWTPEKGTVEVYLSTMAGERTTVLMTGVLMLKVTDLKQGNIIFDVTIRTAEEITLPDIAELYDLQPDREPAPWENKLLEKTRREGFHLFQISPSYGGHCLVLSQGVEFTKNARRAVSALA